MLERRNGFQRTIDRRFILFSCYQRQLWQTTADACRQALQRLGVGDHGARGFSSGDASRLRFFQAEPGPYGLHYQQRKQQINVRI